MRLSPGRVAALASVLLLALAGCGVSSEIRGGSVAAPTSDGDPVAGAKVYLRACSNCHGSDLAGIDGLGKELLPSAFIIEASENDLSALILVGVPADDPSNMTGIDMSAKGGNPSLSSQDVQDVAAYLKASQQGPSGVSQSVSGVQNWRHFGKWAGSAGDGRENRLWYVRRMT